MYKKIRKYFKNHIDYNAYVHMFAGIGIGILITYPLVGSHPVRWGVVFLLVAILGLIYPLIAEK